MTLKDYECPCCTDIFTIPVFRCNNGHPICSKCCPLLDLCPLCRCSYRGTGNLCRDATFEHHLKDLRLPCSNWSFGCKELLAYDYRAGHEPSCPFAVMCCPFYGNGECENAASRRVIVQHLQDKHSCSKTEKRIDTIRVDEIGLNCWHSNLHYVYGHYFIIAVMFAQQSNGRLRLTVDPIILSPNAEIADRFELKFYVTCFVSVRFDSLIVDDELVRVETALVTVKFHDCDIRRNRTNSFPSENHANRYCLMDLRTVTAHCAFARLVHLQINYKIKCASCIDRIANALEMSTVFKRRNSLHLF